MSGECGVSDPLSPSGVSNLNLPGDRRPLSTVLASNSPDSIEDYIRNWRKGSTGTPTLGTPTPAAPTTATSK